MKSAGEKIRSPKERGEWVEARFLAKAAEKGFRVSKPWGDSARYDFAIERDGRFLRIQVKSTIAQRRGGYDCRLQPQPSASGHEKFYTAEQVDFFAAYVIPEDTWYIFPADVVQKIRGQIMLFPQSPGHKYEKYKEAWHLLRAAKAEATPVAEQNEPAVEDANAASEPVLEIRAAVEAAPSVGFDEDLMRGRLAGCFARMRSR
jgi:hypothetical protein